MEQIAQKTVAKIQKEEKHKEAERKHLDAEERPCGISSQEDSQARQKLKRNIME